MIFLTGASGFLGKCLVDKFSKLNIKVCCLSRHKRPAGNNIKWQQTDLTRLPLSPDLLEGCSVVVHAAGAIKGSPIRLDNLNYNATKQLLKIAKEKKVKKFIFISSTDVILSDSAYAKTKRDAEEAVKTSGLNWLIIRPSVIFGKNDTKNFTLLNNLIRKSPLILLPHKGLFRWEPVFIDDLAEYVIKYALEDKISNKCLNVVGSEILTFFEIVNQLEKHNHTKKIKIPISSPVTNFLQKVASVILGTHRSNEIFSSFKDKIVPEGYGEKIKSSTKFSQVYP